VVKQQGCPAERTLDLLAGRWKPLVIYWLLQRQMRFNELQRALGQITHRTLSRTLKEMESQGLVSRRDHGEIPPRVDYSLTALGRSLEPVLQAMHEWADSHPEADLSNKVAE
jgi:DNA-binding HxlR family transcriptional regulator